MPGYLLETAMEKLANNQTVVLDRFALTSLIGDNLWSLR